MNMANLQVDEEIGAASAVTPSLGAQIENELSQEHEFQNDRSAIFLERFAQFRNLRIAGKIKAIFGTFFAVSLAMVLVVGLGLTELWFRYNATAQVQVAALTATELRGATGELRYDTVRFVFEGETSVLEDRRQSLRTVQDKLETLSALVAEYAPQMNGEVEDAAADLAAYDTAFEEARTAIAAQGRNQNTVALAYEISETGDKLFAEADAIAEDLGVYGESMVKEGIDYFFNMVAITAVLALFAGIVMLTGLNYFSRDFSRKIGEVTSGMSQLAKGDDSLYIHGRNRKDEIGEMIRALNLFKRANRQLQKWASERAELAEQEIKSKRARARTRRA